MLLKINKKKAIVVFYALLVLCVSYFTYFRNYWYPNNLFWDENYYIASSYKYLNHVFFMEPHPPLGKLFIAWGEYLFHPNTNIDTADFLTTDHITDIPAGFSFVGVRFFPVVFATISALLFFFILLQISKNAYLSFLFSSFYLFDNALIVHSRAAMLEGIQFFFILLSLYYFLKFLRQKTVHSIHYFFLGIVVGIALSVKLNSSFLLLLFPFLYLHARRFSLRFRFFLDFFLHFSIFVGGSLFVLVILYSSHVQFGQKVLDNRYYNASATYKKALAMKQVSNLSYFPQLFWDNILYIKQYESGVPATDSNGSPFYTWPIGGKSINYRWDSTNGITRYLYLQGNPVIWFSGILGLLGALFLIIKHILFQKKITDKRLFFIIVVLFSLYLSYMLAMVDIHRVMYLYHYLIPLLLSLILTFCVYVFLFREAIQKNDKRLFFLTTLYVASVVLVYYFYSPLTYYLPLTRHEFLLRSWFWFWGMKPI